MGNIILQTDSYKLSHFQQFPDNMVYMFDYIESRGGKYGYTRFFGLQYYLKKYLCQTITIEMLEEAKLLAQWHGVPFNYEGWLYIINELEGKIPIRIRAVDEGSVIPNHEVLVTIESTNEHVPWVVGWVETLLMKIWYPITVATFSYKIKLMIEAFLDTTSDNKVAELPFKLHDFGYRGVSSEESAGIGGMAHLLNFKGTDTIAGLLYAKNYYNAVEPGFSVPASEHSTMTSWGESGEESAFRNMIKKHQQYPIISIVADSYNYWEAVADLLGKKLKAEILAHDGFIVIRPDSGDAVTNVLFALEQSEKYFGCQLNSKGYKVLNKIRILQGDGISEDKIYDILRSITNFTKDNKSKGYSAENLVFGCGGALLQGNSKSSINRDTHKFAMKCSAIGFKKKGESQITLREVFKDPITDRGKLSKKGRLDLILVDGIPKTIVINDFPVGKHHPDSILETVFENGILKKAYRWDQISGNDKLYPQKFPSGVQK
ncbi:MAG: nicotinate phosphoribosyltransferase [Culicoidibacterales bacterium]